MISFDGSKRMQWQSISELHSDLRETRHSRRGADPSLDGVLPVVRKDYPGARRIRLPDPATEAEFIDLLRMRASCKECQSDLPLTLEQGGALLSTLRTRQDATRSYPSGGSRYPIETYLVGAIGDLKHDMFHYDPDAHELEHLGSAPKDLDMATLVHPSPGYTGIAPAVLVFTAVWRRIACKYGDFGFLLALLETGHIAQNVLLMAAATGVGARPMAGFTDGVLNELLGVDGVEEQPVYAIALSSTSRAGVES
jgi:SagB-type dehydrogenase family enzyme